MRFYAAVNLLLSTSSLFLINYHEANGQVTEREEKDILLKIYDELGGNDWTSKANWGSSVDVCRGWFGITCNADGNVVTLSLPKNNLIGTLPVDVYGLLDLEDLYLKENEIDMDFNGIERLSKLTHLQVEQCNITNTVGLGKSTSLERVHMSDNILTGHVEEILKIPSLRHVYVNNNDFEEPIPESIGDLQYLEVFMSFSNGMTGTIPTQIGKATNLKWLVLGDNWLSGTIPTELNLLVDLEELSIRDANLTGTIPSLSNLGKLEYLHFDDNGLTGTIPETLVRASAEYSNSNGKPIEMDLSFNQLTGTVPLGLAHFKNLTIQLENNYLTGIDSKLCFSRSEPSPAIMGWQYGDVGRFGCDAILCPWDTYQEEAGRQDDSDKPCLECPGTGLSTYFGSSECVKSEKKILETIFFATNGPDWTDNTGWDQTYDDDFSVCDYNGIVCKSGTQSIERINLARNNLSGKVPPAIFELEFLKEINLAFNEGLNFNFNGIGNAKRLVRLNLANTELSSLAGIEKAGEQLAQLILTSNFLTGTIPDEIFKLSSLTELYMAQNALTGSLSEKISDLYAIQELHLSNQRGKGFTGPLIDFKNLANLKTLKVSHNSLTGTIPTTFLSGITDKENDIEVDLSYNDIGGIVPSELGSLTKLDLKLVMNKIQGIDQALCANGDGSEWIDGDVAKYGCSAILCPKNYFNADGRQTGSAEKCKKCADGKTAENLGSIECSYPVNEKEILMRFYESTDGDNWYNTKNWGKNDNVCTWYGIECVGSNYGVSKIIMENNNLAGVTSKDIYNLPLLQEINVKLDSVAINFDGIGAAKNLEVLYLSDTGIKHVDGIKDAHNLKTLHLTKNFMTGTFPNEIIELQNLEELYLNQNRLSGTFPQNFGEMKSLKFAYLLANDFTGSLPASIGDLSNLEIFTVAGNHMSGKLPKSMNKLTNLKTLSLREQIRLGETEGGFEGPLLSFTDCKFLNKIYLELNKFTGTIPSNFLGHSKMTDSLMEIALNGNELSGIVPATLSQFTKMEIDLSGNKFESVADELCQIDGWNDGDVGVYGCKGIMCLPSTYQEEIGRASMAKGDCSPCAEGPFKDFFGASVCTTVERDILKKLYKKSGGDKWWSKENWMEDGVSVCTWHGITCDEDNSVQAILLGSNNISGDIPTEIFQLPNLSSLWLYSNPINFSFDGIEEAKNLKSLLLDSTGLESIKGVGKAKTLVELDLRFNKLSGNFPYEEINKLKSLASLALSDNDFTGSFESSRLKNVDELMKLRMSANRFSGKLPNFANYHHLRTLDLSSNRFTGDIPSSFMRDCDSPDVEIDLSSNLLEGGLPNEFTNFDTLTIYLRDNKISDIPASLCEKDNWNDKSVGKFNCDAILCPPGKWNEIGRQGSMESPCVPCKDADFYGTVNCNSISARSTSAASLLRFGVVWSTFGALVVNFFL